MTTSKGVEVFGPRTVNIDRVLTPEALEFLATLQRTFGPQRQRLLAKRVERQRDLDAGARPDFLPETRSVREGDWKVAPAPADLQDRRVEITGPVDRKMIINALNSGVKVFMADLEDATSPTWENVVEGQWNLQEAVRRTLSFNGPEGKSYRLADELATLVVRPRGWHLPENHLHVDGEPISASLFDFGLYFFHNAREALDRGTGPYFYLPKLESHLEARLWNDVFVHAQEALGVPRGSIRATVLIETILAAFEMEEILYELREHMAGLNAGRWDYIFSMIKKFSSQRDFVLPDRAQITMAVPFMRAYAELLVRSCHTRGAHAIGGMAAFIPNRRDPEITTRALQKVSEDKNREASQGFDGTWIAHPDLAPIARTEFDRVLGDRPHQKDRLREDLRVSGDQLLDVRIEGGKITEAGLLNNISVALQYLEAWLGGLGAVAIYNLMEDAATAEISRAQLWQWVRLGATIDDGTAVDAARYRAIREEEEARLAAAGHDAGRLRAASALLDELVLSETFIEFLTIPAYEQLTRQAAV
ncbi:MAG: malate synthase A [Gemmatimonadetes bacterium]|nr:malate synthase A [Gemmatimonadota bacterium]